ncbi:hypothetical protein J0S82_010506, partial [Galemys pyrenaicus]
MAAREKEYGHLCGESSPLCAREGPGGLFLQIYWHLGELELERCHDLLPFPSIYFKDVHMLRRLQFMEGLHSPGLRELSRGLLGGTNLLQEGLFLIPISSGSRQGLKDNLQKAGMSV